MLSGRGIDGELKNKFGELTEKFWQSSNEGSPNQAKNLRAIYPTSEEGGNGQALNKLKGNGGEGLLDETNNNVERFFGVCIGEQRRSGCNDGSKDKSVVLVGDDPNINSSLTWEKLKEQNWNQASLVRSGQVYNGLFKNHIWKGDSGGKESRLNRQKVQNVLIHQRGEKWMRDIMCPWIWNANDRTLQQLNERCKGFNTGSDKLEDVDLIGFLNSNRAREYFKANAWDWRDNDWEYLALLTLLDLWTGAISDVNFDKAASLFSNEVDKFKLGHLMDSNSEVIYLDADNSGNNLKAISYHSGGDWEVQLCPSNGNCSNGNGLNLTLGNGKFCVGNVICLAQGVVRRRFDSLKNEMSRIYRSGSGTWTMVFGSSNRTDHLERLLIALVVACFKDVEKVTLTVQEPSKEGQLIFKLMEGKK